MPLENHNLTLDLPQALLNSDQSNYQVDGNHSAYYIQDQGDALVRTKKYIVQKKFYTPSSLGNKYRNEVVRIKEDQFTDIGGGYASYLQHYAEMPKPWFSFEEKSVLVYEQGDMMGINYDSFHGKNAFGNIGFNYKGATRKTINYLAKATRYYVTKNLMDLYQSARYTLQGKFSGQGEVEGKTSVRYVGGVVLIFYIKGKGFSGSFLRPCMLGVGKGDNEFLINAITKQDYPKRLFVNTPLGTISKTDDSECVIAPDRIRLWQPGIYEITRYTSSINLEQPPSERIPIQVYWNFDESQVFTQAETENLKVTLFTNETMQVEDTSPLNYYFFKDLTSDAEKDDTHDIKIKVENKDVSGIADLYRVKVSSIDVFGAEIKSIPPQNFTQNKVGIKWNNEQPKITMNFEITKYQTS